MWRNVEPIIFYIADRGADAYEEARHLRERLTIAPSCCVDNALSAKVKDKTRPLCAYQERQGTTAMTLRCSIRSLRMRSTMIRALARDIVAKPLRAARTGPHARRPGIRSARRPARLGDAGVRDIHRLTRTIETAPRRSRPPRGFESEQKVANRE